MSFGLMPSSNTQLGFPSRAKQLHDCPSVPNDVNTGWLVVVSIDHDSKPEGAVDNDHGRII
jgi:hypothetical protein